MRRRVLLGGAAFSGDELIDGGFGRCMHFRAESAVSSNAVVLPRGNRSGGHRSILHGRSPLRCSRDIQSSVGPRSQCLHRIRPSHPSLQRISFFLGQHQTGSNQPSAAPIAPLTITSNLRR